MTYGTVNVDSVVNSDGVTSGGLYGFKNRIINGAMMIDQRNAGASITQSTSNQFPVDRWLIAGDVASKFTAQQSSTAPAGFINSLLITSSSAYTVGASESFILTQYVEGLNVADFGWGTANAVAITVSFWVRSSLTGTFGGVIRNSASNRSYPFSYAISAANTWEQKSITIAGDTSGTWLTTNGRGLNLTFSMGSGASVSGAAGAWSGSTLVSATGATSVVGTSGATFYITGVQLEKGSTATSFDYRPYGTELQLAQRYFVSYGGSASYERFGTCLCSATTGAIAMMPFPVEMRTVPTFGYSSLANLGIYTGSSVIAVTAVGGDSPSPKVGMLGLTVASGLTTSATYQFLANNTTSARATWSAEL